MTVEPGFKSTGLIDDDVFSIGEIASRTGVPTSTIRYYERRGILPVATRVSGQRRYRHESLRLSVFIRMFQEAGLSLDEIEGILGAGTVEQWIDIARGRLESLEVEIDHLQQARGYLQGALMCPFGHPLTQCAVIGAEIDRRLATDDAHGRSERLGVVGLAEVRADQGYGGAHL